MDNSNNKRTIYKNGKQIKILGFNSKETNAKRVFTQNPINVSKDSYQKIALTPRKLSRSNNEPLREIKTEKHLHSFKFKDKSKYSPSIYSISKNDIKRKNKTPEITPIINTDINSDFNKRLFETNIKMKFYFLTSTIYLSLFLLCIKILFNYAIPNIPPLGTSLFIISFNNLIFSVVFIIMDQIDYLDNLYFENIVNNFHKMIYNFISVLLIIKSLEKVNLLSFIILVNMKPIIISFINIILSNKIFRSMDYICFFLFGLIIITEFLVENKISIICTFILMAIDIIYSFTKLGKVKSIHSYFNIFGSSLIGISVTPIKMVISRDIFNISFSQYLLFLIISLTLFFYGSFFSKYIQYSFGKKFKIFSLIFIYSLFILYSIFLLRENNGSKTYIFFIFSFFISNYANLRNDSIK